MCEKILCSRDDIIEILGLNVRPRNALRRSGIDTIGALLEFASPREEALFAVRNLGEKGVAEIRERLSRVELLDPPPSTQENAPQNVWTEQPQILIDLGPPSIPRHAVVEWQQMMLARQIEASLLHPQLQIDGYTLVELVDSHRYIAGLYEQLLKILVAPISVSQELEHLVNTVPPREIDILFRRFGFDRQTLETAASDFEITRERVRQIEQQAKRRVHQAASTLQLLRTRSAIRFADDVSLSFEIWSERLLKTGLLGNWSKQRFYEFDQIELMAVICRILRDSVSEIRISENFDNMLRLHCQGRSSAPARTLMIEESMSTEELRLVRRHLQHSGAVSLEWLSEHLQYSLAEMQEILEALDYFEVGHRWYISNESSAASPGWQHVFHKSLFKMFQYCGPVFVRDVYFGIEHTLVRTEFPVPPHDVLEQALNVYGYSNEDDLWYWEGELAEDLNTGEEIILETIRENSGVANHSELMQAIIESPLASPSLHGTLKRSPLFEKFDRGLYKLRGYTPSYESVKRALESRRRIPVDLEAEYDMNGNIVLAANVGILALANGTIVSENLPNLAGEWALQHHSGESESIRVTENEIRGLRQNLQLMDCEVGDRIRMVFSTDTHEVSVALFGDSE